MRRQAPNQCALCNNDFCYHFVCVRACVCSCCCLCWQPLCHRRKSFRWEQHWEQVRERAVSWTNWEQNGDQDWEHAQERTFSWTKALGTRLGTRFFREPIENRMGTKIGNRSGNGLFREPIQNRIGNRSRNNGQKKRPSWLEQNWRTPGGRWVLETVSSPLPSLDNRVSKLGG